MFFNQENTHVSKVVCNRPFNIVWDQISNPQNYPKLYPNWIKSIKKISENRYFVDDQFGQSYEMTLFLNKEFGVVDLQIGKEASRMRIMPLSDDSTVVVHLAKKWSDINQICWFFHKRTTDRDFKNAKAIIEGL
jgi:hypothetical protein